MSSRRQEKEKLQEAREEASKRGARIADMERAHQRLEHLYEISKLLTRFRNVEDTVSEVIMLVAQTLPVRSAILILGTTGVPQTIVWQAQGEGARRLQEAKAHAQRMYDGLVGTGVDLKLGKARTRRLSRPPPEIETKTRFFFLPLVVGQGEIFGALQLEDSTSFDEQGLIFVNAVVNQLAIAVDRQVAIITRQTAAEAREKEQRLLAQVGAVVAASLNSADTLTAIARCAVPLFADLCLVDEVDENGVVRRPDVLFADEEKQRDLAERMKNFAPRPGWSTPQAKVLKSGKPLLFAEIGDPVAEGIAQDDEHADVLRSAGVRSQLVLPLIARRRKIGVLTFITTARSGRHYSSRDLSLAEEIARRAATSIDNARLYEQARQARRAREDLLAVVSHDLRSPLGVILMNLVVMLKTSERDERRKSRKQLLSMQRSANRMNRLIEDLLDTASIESGRLSVDGRYLDVRPLVSEALDALLPLAASRSLSLENELPAELPPVLADTDRLQQVFANLLGNAIKFTPEAGTITVRAAASSDVVTFAVADTGPGIPEGDLPHLFERLWQARRTAKLGIGLGLFIVKGIVESHGGRVWVESKLGQGSTFFFTLPVAHPGADWKNDERASPAGRADALQAESEKRAAEPDLEGPAQEVVLRTRELHTALESTRVARELAERASEFKNDFMAMVSHELRGPLTALELLIERLQRDKETPPTVRQQQLIGRMFAAVTRLSAMIESLLRHALIQSGRLTTQIEVFDARAVAADVLEELRPYAEEKGLQLRLAAAADLPPESSDPELVRLILLNLVGNAIKFTEHGLVEVSITSPAGGHRLTVRDSGPGIPAADRIRIFEAFAQTSDAKQRHFPGMGLGLTLVREVASALGGDVELDSDVGRGSTFTVTLPPMTRGSQEPGASLH